MLPHQRRITKDTDWQRIHKKGQVVHSKYIVLKTLDNKTTLSRFGFLVGAKIDKRATKRNQLKRRLRAIIAQEIKNIEEGNDVIFMARPNIITKTYRELKETVINLLKRSRLYK